MGLPWISKGWNSVYSLAIKPMVTNTSSIVSESSFNLENGPAIKDQVRHLDYKYFYNNYGATYSGLALLGVLFMLVSLTDKKSVNRYSKFMVVSPIVMLFVLTHQTYFGLTMFTARYAMFLGMFISLLVAYALMRLSVLLITTNKKQPINEWFVFLGLVFVSTVGSFGYWSETVDFVNDGFRADISNQYRDFYKTFGEYVGKDDQVVVFANYDKYASGLWPDKNIEPVNRDWICNPKIEKSSKRIESLSLAFGAETNPTDSLMLFEKELGSNYLVLIDLNEKCLNQELFRAEDYGVLTASKNLVLLERLPSSSF